MKRILEIRDLSCEFSLDGERIRAVTGVNFNMYKGEILGVVGESGSGKTTLARMIVGIYSPYSGEIYFEGERIRAGLDGINDELKNIDKATRVNLITSIRSAFKTADEREEILKNTKNENISLQNKRRHLIEYLKKVKSQLGNTRRAHPKIQMIFQDPTASLNPRMTVGEIVKEGLVIKGGYSEAEIDSEVDRMLEKVGLSPSYKSRYPSEFSGGQKQRIGIARALIMKPSLVIADEPVSALDASIGADVINLLLDLRDELGLSVLFIAHDLSLVRHATDRVAVMYKGRLVELAPTEMLYKNPIHPYTVALLSAMPHPDPNYEKGRKRIIPSEILLSDLPLVEIEEGHFVMPKKV